MTASPPAGLETAQPSTWIGRVIDERYRIEELLGEGGMGAVYVAEHLKLRKRVAFKVIHSELTGDGEVKARFAREAMASAQLEHPHVASALDFGSLPEGGAYLVMQLVRGQSLHAIVRGRGAIPWLSACEIGAQVADALTAAHAAGIVHRDLKPDNILLETREDGSHNVKVLDFGIARVAMDEAAAPLGAEPLRALTRIGTVMGTPGYMSPEQAMGEPVDARTDLYALGATLWECIAGQPLYDTHDLTTIVTRQLTETPPPLRTASGDASIPDGLEELVARLLARDASGRPAQASVVRDALRRLAFGSSQVPGAPAAPIPAPTREGESTARTMLADGARPSQTGPFPGSRTQSPVGPGPVTLGRRLAERLAARGPLRWLALGCLGIGLLGIAGVAALVVSGDGDAPREAKPTLPSLRDLLPERLAELASPSVQPEVQERIDTVLGGRNRDERRRAARWLLAHEPAAAVPAWARLGAELETAQGCRAKREVVERIREAGDGRLRPAIRRLHQTRRRGCGFLGVADCYECMRGELAAAMAELPASESDEDEDGAPSTVPSPEGPEG